MSRQPESAFRQTSALSAARALLDLAYLPMAKPPFGKFPMVRWLPLTSHPYTIGNHAYADRGITNHAWCSRIVRKGYTNVPNRLMNDECSGKEHPKRARQRAEFGVTSRVIDWAAWMWAAL